MHDCVNHGVSCWWLIASTGVLYLLIFTHFIYLLGFSVTQTPLGSYHGNFQLLLVKEDHLHMNIGIFACMGRTTDTLQVSWKTSQHKRVLSRPGQARNERLSGWKLGTSTAQPQAPPYDFEYSPSGEKVHYLLLGSYEI